MSRLVQALSALPTWQKSLLVVSVLLTGGGAAWLAVESRAASTPAPRTASHSTPTEAGGAAEKGGTAIGGASLLPDAGRAGSEAPLGEAETAERDGDLDTGTGWPPAMMRGGFSFLLAFAAGFALRLFARLTLLWIGSVVLAILGLSAIGWIDVRWTAPGEQLEALIAGVSAQFSSLKTFLQGSLPSAGMGSVGLFAGLRKK